MGLINEPGYRQAAQPDENGLWIDEADTPEPAAIDPKVYGRSSGITRIRIFPNPAFFDAEAKKKWDAARFYHRSDLCGRRAAVVLAPTGVGASCGARHIAFNPTRPPDDVENPHWANWPRPSATSTSARERSLPTM